MVGIYTHSNWGGGTVRLAGRSTGWRRGTRLANTDFLDTRHSTPPQVEVNETEKRRKGESKTLNKKKGFVTKTVTKITYKSDWIAQITITGKECNE